MQISISNAIGGGGGTQGGGTPTPPPFSNVDSFSFDGVDAYFLGTSTYSELNGATKATISFWIKPQDNGFRILLHVPRNNTNANGQFLIYQRNGRIQMNIDTSSYYCLTPDNTLILNQWQHVMICMDLPSTDEGKIFINGVDQTSAENWYNRTALSPSIGGLYIGEANNGYQSPFYGNLDEVAIWSGTDLRNDVATIYNNGVPTDLNNNGLTAPTTWQRMGENATWNGAKWTMTDVDGVYTNRSISMVEANRTTDVPTPPPFSNTKSILLDGVDDYVSFSQVTYTDEFTTSFWIKPTNLGASFLVGRDTSSDYVWLRTVSQIRVRVNFSTYSFIESGGNDINANAWNHLLICRDSSNNLRIFLNGAIFASSQVAAGQHRLDQIGKVGTSYYDGNVDETAFWDSDQSSNLATIYNSGVPNDISSLSPTLWYRMGDGDTSPTLTDNGSGGNDGTMTNFSTFSTDVPTASSFTNTKSILLDGVDDYVDCGDNDNLSFGNGTTDSPFSISFWVNLNSLSGNNNVFIGKDSGSSNREYAIGMFSNSNKVRFFIKDNGGNSQQSIDSTTNLTTSSWFHIVTTYSGVGGSNAADGMKIYINGSLETSTNIIKQSYTAMKNTSALLTIGKINSSPSQISGLIDETAIFTTELSASDVTSIDNSGVPNDISSLNPLSWWRCGDGDTSPRLTDNGSASNDGTMTNFRTFSTDVPT